MADFLLSIPGMAWPFIMMLVLPIGYILLYTIVAIIRNLRARATARRLSEQRARALGLRNLMRAYGEITDEAPGPGPYSPAPAQRQGVPARD